MCSYMQDQSYDKNGHRRGKALAILGHFFTANQSLTEGGLISQSFLGDCNAIFSLFLTVVSEKMTKRFLKKGVIPTKLLPQRAVQL